MQFNTSLLSTADQGALATAIAGIPAVLTSLSAAITQAQTTGAKAITLAAQVAAFQAQISEMLAPGGGFAPQDPAVLAIVQQSVALTDITLVADHDAAGVNSALYMACQSCNPLLQVMLPIALRQATAEVWAVLAPFFPPGTLDKSAANNTGLHLQLTQAFSSATQPTPNKIVQTLKIAMGIQALLQAIEAGTAIVSLG